ncbi:MAG: VanW family protein [Capsulimonadales bacterium]|nr:VanW family protein [Capsulimonadales bacterium]
MKSSLVFAGLGVLVSWSLPTFAFGENAPPAGPQTVTKIVLTDGGRTAVRTAKELGLFPQPDEAALRSALSRIARVFRQEPINARLFLRRGVVRVDPGTYARALNVAETADRLLKTYRAGLPTQTITVVLDKNPPEITTEQLKRFDTVLSRVETKAWNHPGRNHNIALATNLIDGTIVPPGGQFSLNETVGERTKARGFRESIIFVESREVRGVGGGVSQITGTVFNAAAEAGMRIDEAHFHSRPVPYLPLGYDATVAWGQKDMKFTNDLETPVYVGMDWKRPYLTATLYGTRQPGRQVRMQASVRRLGPGRINASLYRTIKLNGRVVRKEKIVSHAYRWDPNDNEVHDD